VEGSGQQEGRVRVSLVIPAYNEAERLPSVVETAAGVELIDEIVVVDDGSRDGTARAAQRLAIAKLRLFVHPQNLGKGMAMLTGFKQSRGRVVAFVDADLIGLRPDHLVALVEPVLLGECDATLGVFQQGRAPTDLAQKVAPGISGQRAVRRELLEGFADWDQRYGIEVALNHYLEKAGAKVRRVELRGLSHQMKEEKRGLLPGFVERMAMYRDILGWKLNRLVRRNRR